ncbi:helix-turn-helix domain-containing protein [Avibacterium paragallinarum]|uniref:helix-turn-helix domain-containing protein n=1 Tax=Avibacterium paragallinarum TaxID=728 RepID=UPI00397864E4
MNVNEKIRKLREAKEWSQEQMAEKMSMSLNGYAKIERGETKLHLDKLEQIAQILDIDVVNLISPDDRNVCLQIGDNIHLSPVYQGNNDQSLLIEIEKLKLSLSYSQQIIAQKDEEIRVLKEMIELLKLNQKS